MIPVVDVFAGCGGFAEGFSACQQNGSFPFDVRLSIEKETSPVRTLQSRAFYHQFRSCGVPDSYYDYISGQITRDELILRHPLEAAEATNRCLQLQLGDGHSEESLVDLRIAQAIGVARQWVLLGGPPCQAYSTIGRVRNRGINSYDPDADERFDLYREYRNIIRRHWPAVFVMENVRGVLSASRKEQRIFDDIVNALGAPGGDWLKTDNRYKLYSLTPHPRLLDGFESHSATDFIVKAEDYGVPQTRHRVIILGVRADIPVSPWPLKKGASKVSSATVLSGLPRVRSGLSHGDDPEQWRNAVREIVEQPWWNDIQPCVQGRICDTLRNLNVPEADRGASCVRGLPACDYKSDWFVDQRLPGVLNHETRGHRKDDLWRYLYAACYVQATGRRLHIRDFPTGLRPNHKNVTAMPNNGNFSDRFSVVPSDAPSRTVVSHIYRDGHYYIHYDPTQCRSLTVREAARLQTFPDNYFFEGSRTSQYEQVGNAVPPLLSLQIAKCIADLLERWQGHTNGHSIC